jgi:diaminohydroxyphosphoribosylaminopyrimidine deaminase / 5-amino-6-(5-phosphoribosylamino)uracil reductase
VIVGSGTVLADDPCLTVRLPDYAGPQPLRVVLDRRGRTLDGAPWQVYDGTAPTLVLTAPGREPGSLPRNVEHAAAEDLHGALAVLGARQVTSALLEGGAGVLGAAVAGGLADKLVVHVAPLLLGERGRPLLVGDGIGTIGAAPRFALDAAEPCGDDVVATYYPRREAA